MSYSSRVKSLAYTDDPGCWKSYSGRPQSFKRKMDVRRVRALEAAQRFVDVLDKIDHRYSYEQLRNVFKAVCYSRDFGTQVARNILANVSQGRASRLSELRDDEWRPMYDACVSTLATRSPMPPMKIAMMLHFSYSLGPFGSENDRNSESYVRFVRELLAAGMVERPSNVEREVYKGFAYRATLKGIVYVEALSAMPLPVQATPLWVMPKC